MRRRHIRFRAVIGFLQKSGLTTRTILDENDIIGDDTCIHTEHLNENGKAIMKKCYRRWLKKVDKGLNPDDVSMFQNEFDRSIKQGSKS